MKSIRTIKLNPNFVLVAVLFATFFSLFVLIFSVPIVAAYFRSKVITMEADARAEARKREGDAEAYYNEKVAPTITDNLIRMECNEKEKSL